MFKHILIPTDGSEISQKAIKAGVAFAKSIGARVTGYYALHEPPFLYNRFGDLDNQIKAELDAGRLGGIIDAAKKCKCDAIFLAPHGRSGMRRLILGSVTQDVLSHSTLPVIVYR